MDQIEREIGEAAGRIWNELYANGPMSKSRISKATGFPIQLVNQGIGWLAREGKLTTIKQRGIDLIKLKE